MKLMARWKQVSLEAGYHVTAQELAQRDGVKVRVINEVMRVGHQCKDAMMEHNMRLVVSLSRKFRPKTCGVSMTVRPRALHVSRRCDGQALLCCRQT